MNALGTGFTVFVILGMICIPLVCIYLLIKLVKFCIALWPAIGEAVAAL